jgi:hypothetical protein
MMNGKDFKELVVAYYLGISLRGAEEKHKNLKMARVRIETRNKHLPNACLER